MNRQVPTCCQFEPGYPEHQTAVISIRFPDYTCHDPNEYCDIEDPHLISECSYWNDLKKEQ